MNASKWSIHDRPDVASEWIVQQPSENLLLVRSESTTKVLRGVLADIMCFLDGEHSVGELLKVLGHIPGDKVIEALQVLEYECLITRSTPTEMTRSEAAFWRMTGTDEGCVANNRDRKSVV